MNVDVFADTVFRDEALGALNKFTGEHKFPVSRSQIQEVRQIAFNQPGELRDFADRQKKKAERQQKGPGKDARKSVRLDHEIAFWDLIFRLGGSANSPAGQWSLYRFAEDQSPADAHAGKKPHGSATPEEHKVYREARQRSDSWHKKRMAEDYPAFFQRFCAHYLYLQSKQDQGGGRDDQ